MNNMYEVKNIFIVKKEEIIMALLGNPFVANCPRQMSNEELAQAIRVDIAGELEAIIGYEAHVMATADERVKNVLGHIADYLIKGWLLQKVYRTKNIIRAKFIIYTVYLCYGGKTLKKLNPEKLYVSFGKGTVETEPIIPRKYTLTHSDGSGELFLTIAGKYDYDKISDMRDEVLAEWIFINNEYTLMVYVMVDKERNLVMSAVRNSIFVKELPLALQAIRYGDREFFVENSALERAPIHVKFNSIYPLFNRQELWGTPLDYN